MSFLHRIHSPALAARLSETHERVYFLARAAHSPPRCDDEDETSREATDGEEDDRG